MFPTFEIFGLELHSYGLIAFIGVMAASVYAFRSGRKAGIGDISMLALLLISAVGAVIGSHILFGITNIVHWHLLFSATDFAGFIENVDLLFGGAVFYGGLYGGLITGYFVSGKLRLNRLVVSDIAAAVCPLFHCFGRLGCFVCGCCYGVESEVGFTFTNAVVDGANGVTRFPVQLLESGLCLMLFAVAAIFSMKGVLKQRLLGLYFCCYAVGRFGFEFLRGDTYRGFLFGLSTSQWISILTFVIGIAILMGMGERLLGEKRSSVDAADSSDSAETDSYNGTDKKTLSGDSARE